MLAPDFLAVGCVTRDRVGGRVQPGGSAYYCASTATKLGKRAAVWTSAEERAVASLRALGIDVALSSTSATTTFTHDYDRTTGSRVLRCDSKAEVIRATTLPAGWETAPLVVLCPNGGEVTPDLFGVLRPRCLAFLPQGWFRRFHTDGSVTFGRSLWPELPGPVDLVVVSEDDLAGDPQAWPRLKAQAGIAVRTLGKSGHIVAFGGKERKLAPPHVSAGIDPTGAGDVFAAAMLIALSEGADPVGAADFGSAAASFSVEKEGIAGLQGREEIFRRLTSPARGS